MKKILFVTTVLLGGCLGTEGDSLDSSFESPIELSPTQSITTTSFSSLGYLAVAVGRHHTLALRSDGKVFAAGYNGNGELGNGTTSPTYYGTPTQVVGLANVIAIAAGGATSYALTSNGKVWAWGAGAEQQLGIVTTTPQLQPVQVPLPSSVTIKEIASGWSHALAIDQSGNIWTWGSNSHGQLGHHYPSAMWGPQKLPNITATAVDGGDTFSLALRADGVVVAWGSNEYGQLGLGHTNLTSAPTVTNTTGVTAIAAGRTHAVAIKHGEIWTWGNNSGCALGIGSTNPAFSAMPLKTSYQCFYDCPPPTAGGMFSFVGDNIPFGPIAPGVNLQAWGYNAYGQLGIGNLVTARSTTSEGGKYPNNSSVLVKYSESGATASAGSYHAAVIDNNGQVVTWGRNDFGQLGIGSTASRSWATATIFP